MIKIKDSEHNNRNNTDAIKLLANIGLNSQPTKNIFISVYIIQRERILRKCQPTS